MPLESDFTTCCSRLFIAANQNQTYVNSAFLISLSLFQILSKTKPFVLFLFAFILICLLLFWGTSKQNFTSSYPIRKGCSRISYGLCNKQSLFSATSKSAWRLKILNLIEETSQQREEKTLGRARNKTFALLFSLVLVGVRLRGRLRLVSSPKRIREERL